MGSDLVIFCRIVQEIHDFHKPVLGLVLSGDIRETCLYVILGIDFSATLSELHKITHSATFGHIAADTPHSRAQKPVHQHTREHPPKDEIQKRGAFAVEFLHKTDLAVLVGTRGR